MKFIYLEIKITMPTIPDEIFGRLTQVYYTADKKQVCVYNLMIHVSATLSAQHIHDSTHNYDYDVTAAAFKTRVSEQKHHGSEKVCAGAVMG